MAKATKYKEIKIQEPWWGAWKTFGWAKGIWGVGLKAKDVDKAIDDKKKLKITFLNFKETYIVSPVTVKNFAENNKTKYKARRTMLYVVPQTTLKQKDEPEYEWVIGEDNTARKVYKTPMPEMPEGGLF